MAPLFLSREPHPLTILARAQQKPKNLNRSRQNRSTNVHLNTQQDIEIQQKRSLDFLLYKDWTWLWKHPQNVLMAVAKSASSSSRKNKNNESERKMMGQPKSDQKQSETEVVLKHRKRTKCPGVRVVGGRIYDPQNGKTCHQCRQKTMDFTAECNNEKKNKPCTIKFCHKCLLNRYGENAEEMAALDHWKCPKCRGICNCSFCMKKRGHKPTGILVHTAKATGFSSVSEMLHVQGPDNLSRENIAKDKDHVVAFPSKQEKESVFDGTADTSSHPQHLPSIPDDKPKKFKMKGLNEMGDSIRDKGSSQNSVIPDKVKEGDCAIHDGDSKDVSEIKKEDKCHIDAEAIHWKLKKDTDMMKCEDNGIHVIIKLPQGTELTSVAEIDFPHEDVGNALQFLEFCATFGEVLGIKEGQPESILREIMYCRSRRSWKYSSVVQFQTQLLGLLQDLEEESPSSSPTCCKNSWFHALKKCLAESECELKEVSLDCIDKRVDGYDALDCSQKLRLLTFLCDETLCTMEMRRWIDEQNSKYSEKQKEAKEKLTAAKEKEKLMKKQLQNNVAKAIIAKNGAPLTISEHESVISEIKSEAARVHVELVEARGLVPKRKQRSDAVRTEPIILNADGHAYWILKGYSSSEIVLQDVGCTYEDASCEKWFSFDDEEKKVIEKCIPLLRAKRPRRKRDAHAPKAVPMLDQSCNSDDMPPSANVHEGDRTG
ncbi:hypothetical protein Nepgr_032443 [Nepenthes gracilis]|uniref:DDT domain-containing protein n=1 Tax=Nepenthes gracilis TaxID=150966 RepID=A0AAD3Y7P1_NEPGR|nr:hypothetical protein Nepgr_032443 [Nepenthes gracilis]